MTKNQIEYAKLLEQRRANQEQEAVKRGELAETARHNLAGEQHAYAVLGETRRQNAFVREMEPAKLEESKRHSLATELETARAHRADEKERAAQRQQARFLELQKLGETTRHNTTIEGQQQSRLLAEIANWAASQVLGQQQLAQRAAEHTVDAAERARHNVAMELKSYSPQVTVQGDTITQSGGQTLIKGGSTHEQVEQNQPKAVQQPAKRQTAREEIFESGGRVYRRDESGEVYEWREGKGWGKLTEYARKARGLN